MRETLPCLHESMTIRPAVPADIPAAAEIQRASLADGHPYEYANNINWPLACVNLVAEEDGAVVGFVSILLNTHTGPCFWQRVAPYVAFVGVLESHRKRKIGEALLKTGIALAKRASPAAHHIYLEHDVSNTAAQRLYLRMGFRTMSTSEILEVTGIENYKHPAMVLDL